MDYESNSSEATVLRERSPKSVPEVAATSVDEWNMAPVAGIAAGVVCAVFVVALLYSCVVYRRNRRQAKNRRHVNMMQASDAALHTPIGRLWSTECSSSGYSDELRSAESLPRLTSARPRQPSVDGYANSGITLKAEVLDSAYYSGTFKKKTRMNRDLAQAIAAFGLPKGGLSSLRNKNKDQDDEDRLELPANMEVVYQERTAV